MDSLTVGNFPQKGNQGSKVGVNTKQIVTAKPKSLGAIVQPKPVTVRWYCLKRSKVGWTALRV